MTVRALDCPLGAVTRLSAGGGALPVIMSIIGPRVTHDYRNYNLLVRGIGSSRVGRNIKYTLPNRIAVDLLTLVLSSQPFPPFPLSEIPGSRFPAIHRLGGMGASSGRRVDDAKNSRNVRLEIVGQTLCVVARFMIWAAWPGNNRRVKCTSKRG